MSLAFFYNNPVALDSTRHANLALAPTSNMGFARPSNAIPINLVEFSQAAKCYPIGFIGGEKLFPVAIVGLGKDNLFVDADGRWKAGAYVPAYVRRYPFIFAEGVEGVDKDRLTLCIEDSPGVVTSVGGQRLFENGKPSWATQQALEFCQAYHAAGLATQPFTKALIEAKLLVDRRADATLTAGGKASLDGFKSIDLDRLQSLPAKTLNQWNGRNWLVPLYAHVQSMHNWGDLVELLAARQKEAAA
jgi:hypothetical protein